MRTTLIISALVALAAGSTGCNDDARAMEDACLSSCDTRLRCQGMKKEDCAVTCAAWRDISERFGDRCLAAVAQTFHCVADLTCDELDAFNNQEPPAPFPCNDVQDQHEATCRHE